MPDATYFEVRCERCQTSFAPGTRQCVHCGGPIGRRLLPLTALAGPRPGIPARTELPTEEPDSQQPDLGRFFRIALIGLGILAAIARVLFENG
jgi:hypothetical protein